MSTKNKLMDFLNVDLSAPKMSNVDLTHSNRLTMSPGYIYPTAVIECLPSDRIRLNLKTILKSDPTVSSLYASFRQSHQAYFVPARLYVKQLDQNGLFGGIGTSGMTPDDYPQLPTLRWRVRAGDGIVSGPSDGRIHAGSLLENLGIFPTNFSFRRNAWSYDDEQSSGEGISINGTALVGYYDILRNYYFNAQEPEMSVVQAETRAGGVFLKSLTRKDLDEFISYVYNGDFDNLWEALYVSNIPELYDATNSDLTFEDVIGHDDDLMDIFIHTGYGLRTYDDDYFSTFLSSEFVDEIDNNARVLVNSETNSFNISQLRRAYRLDKHNNRNLLGGGNSYDDYIYVHFNTSLGRELNKPYFLGSYSQDFYFNDIYSQTQQAQDINNGSLGDRAGILNASADARDFVDFTCKEYGYLIVVSSIIPRVDYYRGIPKMYLKTSMADLYSPEFDAWGYQGIPNIEVDAVSTILMSQMTATQKQPAWFEHMTIPNRVHGLFTTSLEHSFSVLTKGGKEQSIIGYDIGDLRTSYVRPWNFNYIFEFQQSWYDHFTMQILFDCTAYRPISKQILPTL